MLAQTPPMGWNTWNTFAQNIDEKLIMETVDRMVADGYRDAGYEYVVIDDCWSLRERDEKGLLCADPVKFPHGMKYLADYIHSKGMKFGMYSCAGVRTCARYPGSFDHEYDDARTFAEWGVDYLKYDFCNFPSYADNQHRYLTMAMALRSTGRDILFSACNWGKGEPWNWMRSVGAHIYRSTHDIVDTFDSAADIMISQADKLNANAAGCFNDLDMLTVGMFGKGNVGRSETASTMDEYDTQFGYWCFCASPLMIGADVRDLDEGCRKLLQNPGLIALDQDPGCRPPCRVAGEAKKPTFVRFLSDGFAIGTFNFHSSDRTDDILFANLGVPFPSGVALELTDVFTGEKLGVFRDHYASVIRAHHCRILKARFVRV